MTDISKIVELHELGDSKREVARETGTSRNTVKKYIERVTRVREGKETGILFKNNRFARDVILQLTAFLRVTFFDTYISDFFRGRL